MIYAKLNLLEIELYDHLTVYINKMFLQIIFYINKQDLALNNQQWLICHKTKQLTTDIHKYSLRLYNNDVHSIVIRKFFSDDERGFVIFINTEIRS